MVYYFLPDRGIFGGVKVACQFVDLLNDCGVAAAAAFPGGRAPDWFTTRAPVLPQAEAVRRLREDDWKMITWPPDHARLRELPGRLVCHCQGTDARMDAIFADDEVVLLTCWEQAADYARENHGRRGVAVGISVSDPFFFDAGAKVDNRVAYMPRRGFSTACACMSRCRELDFRPIDGLPEEAVATRLKEAGIFLATARGEQFGLPALEAMAAGCVVLSVPVKGGMEFLDDGDNCVLAEPGELPDRLRWISRPENAGLRARLRHRAIATATRYRMARQRRRLRRLVASDAWPLGRP